LGSLVELSNKILRKRHFAIYNLFPYSVDFLVLLLEFDLEFSEFSSFLFISFLQQILENFESFKPIFDLRVHSIDIVSDLEFVFELMLLEVELVIVWRVRHLILYNVGWEQTRFIRSFLIL
jgi:hypothetical protein